MYYAIRHKPTGHFLPRFLGKQGGTWVEPTDKQPPRLFNTGRHAALALNHWLEGQKTISWGFDITGDDYRNEKITKVASRKPEDMEIVRIRLEVDHD